MKITKRQLRRFIKEVHPEYHGLPQSDIDYYELADDYVLWVEDFGQGVESPSNPGVMASYFLEKGLENDHAKHEMLGKAFKVGHDDIMRDIKLQQAERSTMKESIRKIIVRVLSEAMPPGGVPDVVGAVSGVDGEERRQLMDALEKEYGLKVKTTEEFGTSPGGVWIAAESSDVETSDGLPLFDYYMEDEPYVFGVHEEFEDFLKPYGFFPEWNDPGTLMLWEA